MQLPRKVVLRVGLALAGLFALGVLWFALNAYPLGSSGPAVIVNVTPGESVSQLDADLARQGVISSTLAFRIDTTLFGAPTITPGYFAIDKNSSFSHVRAVFSSAPNAVAVTVRPGVTLHEVAIDVASAVSPSYASDFMAATGAVAAKSPFGHLRSLEGMLGTGQYVIAPGESAKKLLEKMADRFVHQAEDAGVSAGARINGLGAYPAIIAASIVEKEGYYPKNMPKVARVVLNRLSHHAGLQMDSTILYALGMDGGTVTPAMLRIHSPYNTYLHAGLTPSPICVPSMYALRAMVKAPPGTWYYFTLVSRDGTEAFASTFAQQLANERLAASRGL
jgi:UPF0755 protein